MSKYHKLAEELFDPPKKVVNIPRIVAKPTKPSPKIPIKIRETLWCFSCLSSKEIEDYWRKNRAKIDMINQQK